MAKFELGQTVITPGALELLKSINVDPRSLLDRHVSGDWGDLDDDDKKENECALKGGSRILSAYYMLAGPSRRVWIITEADRSATTILLPEEY